MDMGPIRAERDALRAEVDALRAAAVAVLDSWRVTEAQLEDGQCPGCGQMAAHYDECDAAMDAEAEALARLRALVDAGALPADAGLARRAVAATGWRWMPGMAWVQDFAGGQTLGDRSGRILTEWDAVDDGGRVFRFGPGLLPDLDDPATAGWLDALMRERWGGGVEVMPYATRIDDGTGDGTNNLPSAIWWRLESIGIVAGTLNRTAVWHPDHPNRYIAGPTKVAALVAALEVPRG